MKTAMLLFFTLFSSIFSLQAENWDLFPYNQKTYFHFTGENVDAISPFYVDYLETHNEADYQYILRNYIEELSDGCYESLHTNELWIEHQFNFPNEVMVYQDGWYGETVFEANLSNLPSLIFHAQAKVGDSWMIESDNYQDFTHLLFTCNSIEEESVLDLVDKVKTFRVHALQNSTPVNSPFNNIIFKISERYGLVQGIPLKQFLQNEPTVQMQLKGLEDEAGNLHGREAYTILDFVPEYSVGDILKWENNSFSNPWNVNIYHRDSITDVTITATSISYTYNRVTNNEVEQEVVALYNQVKSYDISTFDTPINLLYHQIAIDEQKNIFRIHHQLFPPFPYSLSLSENKYLNIRYAEIAIEKECAIAYNIAIYSPNSYFHPQLGLIRQSIVPSETESLIGYRIGDKIGGDIEPIVTNIESLTHFAEQITLHPNPTQNRFRLQLQNPKRQDLQLTITDIHGRTLQQIPLLQSSIEVDLSEQTAGIYLVQISDGQNWWTEKVVKF